MSTNTVFFIAAIIIGVVIVYYIYTQGLSLQAQTIANAQASNPQASASLSFPALSPIVAGAFGAEPSAVTANENTSQTATTSSASH